MKLKKRITTKMHKGYSADLARMEGQLNLARTRKDTKTLRLYEKCWIESIARIKKILKRG